MSTVIKKSFDEEVSDGLNEWLRLHPESIELDKDDIASWLIKHHGYRFEKQQLHKQIAKRVSRVFGKREVKNEQGKTVSEFHAATFSLPGKKTQKTLWVHRLKLTSSFAHTSFDQRLKQAEGVCRTMHVDAEDINTNNPNLADNPIQLELDFSYVQGQAEPRKVQTLPILPAGSVSKKLAKKNPR
jgi:hypothetical protein